MGIAMEETDFAKLLQMTADYCTVSRPLGTLQMILS